MVSDYKQPFAAVSASICGTKAMISLIVATRVGDCIVKVGDHDAQKIIPVIRLTRDIIVKSPGPGGQWRRREVKTSLATIQGEPSELVPVFGNNLSSKLERMDMRIMRWFALREAVKSHTRGCFLQGCVYPWIWNAARQHSIHMTAAWWWRNRIRTVNHFRAELEKSRAGESAYKEAALH